MTYKEFKIIENGKEVTDGHNTYRVFAVSSREAVIAYCRQNWIDDKKTVKAIEVSDNE